MMRRYSAIASALLLAGCSSQVAQTPDPSPLPVPVSRPQQGQLIGRSAAELLAAFGSPALQVHEGSSLKLQFRAPSCVLDAYLYPSSAGMRVTHVDTRSLSGADINQETCISELGRAS